MEIDFYFGDITMLTFHSQKDSLLDDGTSILIKTIFAFLHFINCFWDIAKNVILSMLHLGGLILIAILLEWQISVCLYVFI